MDSGNSGSLQSSSGGDEEYDSRNESISAFFNPSSAHVPSSFSNPSHHHHHLTHLPSSSSSTLFDPLSNYLDAFSRSPPPPSNAGNSMLNLDMVWQRGLRSEPPPTCTEFPSCVGGGLMSSSSSTTQTQQQQQAPPGGGGRVGPFHGSSSSSSMPLHYHPAPPPPPQPENNGSSRGANPSGSSSDQLQTNNPVVVRGNSKKRSRASRRAPTTVLTTDTSNFRAMVQEFTGIPAPPFSASPFAPRNRLDLFSTASTTTMNMRSSSHHHLDPNQPPPYLLRPFAQKFHAPPFASSASTTSSSSIVDVIAANPSTTSGGSSIMASNSTSTNNHQQLLSDHLGLTKQTQNLLNMQNNPMLTFQSLLQSSSGPHPHSPSRYPLANVPAAFGAKSQGLSLADDSSQLRMGTMEADFTIGGGGGGHHHGLSSLVTSNGMSTRNDDNHSSWGDGMGLNDGDQAARHQAHQLKTTFNGNNYSGTTQQQRGMSSSCKMNYSTSASEFQVDKGTSDNVSSRGEGMVDSWICSSD